MQITIDSFYDPSTETYATLNVGVKPDEFETEAETVTWVFSSNKSDSLTLKDTADKAAQLAFRFSDGTYNQSAFNKAYGIAFACVHCTGYTRSGVEYPALTWDQAMKLTPSTSARYPLLDDTVLSEYVRRATTFLLPVRQKQAKVTPEGEKPKDDTATA